LGRAIREDHIEAGHAFHDALRALSEDRT
jgi:hypothetical protein